MSAQSQQKSTEINRDLETRKGGRKVKNEVTSKGKREPIQIEKVPRTHFRTSVSEVNS